MNNNLDEIEELYSDNVAEDGCDPKSVGWEDESSQHLRFRKMTTVINVDDAVTINDLGCGYGALYKYLTDERDLIVDRYDGYDISEKMIERARKAFNTANVNFQQGDELTAAADYSFASGIFNVKMTNDEDEWREHVYKTLNNLYEHSRRGFAFNLLSTYVDYEEDHLYYGDPAEYLTRCLEAYSREATLYHDYGLYGWTITVTMPDSDDN